jgi:hypothetical protein
MCRVAKNISNKQSRISDKVSALVLVEVLTFLTTKTKVKKGKAIPLQAWTGPEGSRWLRPPDFKINGT